MFVYSSCVECFNIGLRNSCPSLLLLTPLVADAARFTTADFPLLCNVWLISLYNLMLCSISALHTSFYNLHQFVYLDSHAHAKCLLHIGLLMNIPVAQGHISDGLSRYKLTRTSAEIFNQIENTPFSDNLLLSVF